MEISIQAHVFFVLQHISSPSEKNTIYILFCPPVFESIITSYWLTSWASVGQWQHWKQHALGPVFVFNYQGWV